MIIDLDVHEPLDQAGIDRYVDPVWAGWHPIIPPLPYRIPGTGQPAPRMLEDAVPSIRQPRPPLTYETIRDDLLEAHLVDVAVLTGTVHPGNAVTQLEYHAAFARAHNDWLANEWLTRDERLYGSIQVMSQVPDEAAAEIERCAANPRMVQVLLPARGGEGFGLRTYRPIFEAAARHGLAVAFHVSASSRPAAGYPESLAEWHAGVAQSAMGQVLSLAFSGVFEEHPSLRVVVLGLGWTWVPYLMWTMDSNYRPLRAEVPWVPRLPSEYLREHLYFCVNPVPSSAPIEHLLAMIDMARHDGWLVWGSDYPNRGWASPSVLDGFPGDLRTKILGTNALRLYGARLASARART